MSVVSDRTDPTYPTAAPEVASKGPGPSRIGPRRRATNFVKDHSVALIIGALLLWLVAAPIALLVEMSFRTGTPADQGAFTFQNYDAVYGNSLTYPALANTLVYAGTVTLISIALATIFAWLVERTDMPGRNFAWVALLIPIAMPGMLAAMAWILLGSPRIGLVNVALRGCSDGSGSTWRTGPSTSTASKG